MDAYLTAEAFQSLSALAQLSKNPKAAGYLLGHKRGYRFVVEKIVSAANAARPTPESDHRLDRLFKGKVIGFFTFSEDKKLREAILKPYACGKILLGVRRVKNRGLSFRAFRIDYEGRFYMVPIEVLRDKEGSHE